MYRLSQLFVTLFAVALSTGLQGQQVTARVAGLESNAKYMSLLEQEQRLHRTEDSVVQVINDTRKLFTAETTDSEKEQLGTKILQLEKELFEIRNQQGVTANEIGAIEQDFILKNLNGTAENPAAAGTPAPAGGKQTPNLVYNVYFKENLSEQDYKALRHAQELEPLPLKLLGTYLENYRKTDSLATLYDTTANKTLAEETYAQLESIGSLNRALSDSLSHVWNYIYDNKTYAYNYLLDKMGKNEMLDKFGTQFRNNRQQIAAMQDSVASETVYGYPLNKRLLLGYEEALAGILGYTAARDSVNKQAEIFGKLHYDLPKIAPKERIFIEYADIERASPSKYNASNPIPEMEVYRQGTVYRIQLGAFTQKQAVSLFKGVYPLCYEKSEDGKFRYFAGAFRDAAAADAGLAKLKSMGFRKPEIVVWRDGRFEIPGETGGEGTAGELSTLYRVEIAGQGETISEAIKEVTDSQAAGKELSRATNNDGSYLYSIGNFDSKEAADSLCRAINAVSQGSATVLALDY